MNRPPPGAVQQQPFPQAPAPTPSFVPGGGAPTMNRMPPGAVVPEAPPPVMHEMPRMNGMPPGAFVPPVAAPNGMPPGAFGAPTASPAPELPLKLNGPPPGAFVPPGAAEVPQVFEQPVFNAPPPGVATSWVEQATQPSMSGINQTTQLVQQTLAAPQYAPPQPPHPQFVQQPQTFTEMMTPTVVGLAEQRAVAPVVESANVPPKLNGPPPGVTVGENPVLAPAAAPVVEPVAVGLPSQPVQPLSEVVQGPIPQPKYYRPNTKPPKHAYVYSPPHALHPMLTTRRVFGNSAAGMPEKVDLRKFCQPVREQERTGACFASAAFVESLWHALSEKALPGHLSAEFINRSFGALTASEDLLTLAEEFFVLVKHGTCPESFMRSDRPDDEAIAYADDYGRCVVAAAPFRLREPLQVDFTNPNAVKAVLSSERTIAISFAAHESFEEPGEGGLLALPGDDEPLLGGHAVLVVGYDKRGWIIRNSWGTSWGDVGYATMPYGYEKHWFEAWTATG